MPPGRRTLILASAGSGKTFQISSRIIALLAEGVSPATILASTFTRKAAGEILDRVLARLARGAADDAGGRALADEVGVRVPGMDARAFWRDVLLGTVRRLHELDIGTLDALFVRVVSGHPHEIGLPGGWRIADEETEHRLRADAVEAVLVALGRDASIELIRGLGSGERARGVHQAILRQVRAIHAVDRDQEGGGPGWDASAELLRARIGTAGDAGAEEGTRPHREELACRMSAVPVPRTAKGGPDSRWVKALEKAGDAVLEGEWGTVVGEGILAHVLTGNVDYCGRPIPDELRAVAHDARALARRDVAMQLVARAASMRRLAERFGEVWERLLVESGTLGFDDVTRLASGIGRRVGGDDLSARLGAEARHLLLDEFQDTSVLQWSALRPVADRLLPEGAPEGTSAVIVADPKQSIYGWRGAAPLLVEGIGEEYGLHRASLHRSWRSSQVVLDAVNEVFAALTESRLFAEGGAERQAAASWGAAFTRHEAERDLPGHVRLLVGPRVEGRETLQPEILRFASRVVGGLWEDSPGRSIGVLARTNAAVAYLIHTLRERGVPCSEEGGTRLTDSGAVVSLLALLRVADHPGNRLARYHVARTAVGRVVGLEDWEGDADARRVSERLRRALQDEGYGPTISGLRGRLLPHCTERDAARLQQFAEFAYRYDARSTLRVDDFVRAAEAEKMESPGEADVRVMTIHRAKGLEFDAVVVPELHNPIWGGPMGNAPPLVRREGGAGPVTHIFPPIRSEFLALFDDVPEIREAREQARSAEVRDELSALYVAMTRARHALVLQIPADREGRGRRESSRPTLGDLLREMLAKGPGGLCPPDEHAEEGQVRYEWGDPAWAHRLPALAAGRERTAQRAPEPIRLRHDRPRHRLLPRRAPSEIPGSASRESPFPEPLPSGPAPPGSGSVPPEAGELSPLDRGALVHGWLERMDWVDDGLPPREELVRIAWEVAPGVPAGVIEGLGRWLETCLLAPPIRDRLRRGEHPGEVTLERELPFLVREEDVLVEGTIDRLVLIRDRGTIVAAEILDFKTDLIAAGDEVGLAERVARHRPQLESYRRAVARMYGLAQEQVRAWLLFLAAGASVPVD